MTDRAVYVEQVKIVYGQTLTAAFGNVAVAPVFAWIFWEVSNKTTLKIWLACMLFVSAARILLYLAFLKRQDNSNVERWGALFQSLTFVQGSIWGVAWIVFLPVEDPIYTVVAALWIVGLSGASVSAYSVHFKSLLSFFVPVVLPGVAHLFVIGGRLNTAVGLAICLYFVVLLRAVILINRSSVDAIRLNIFLEKEIHERFKAEEKLKEISRQDSLTGIHNRRYFDEILEAETQRAQRNSQPLSLILLDIDYFKEFNDSYGHVEGDRCLQRLGLMVQDAAKRPGDLAARYGGDELAVILPNTDAKNALRIAETLRQDICSLQLEHVATRVDGCTFITISAGIATIIPDRETEPSDIIQLSDGALYEAKSLGRNQSVVHTEG